MPNWCYSEIRIAHKDEKKLKELELFIDKWQKKDFCENGFGLQWLGNIVGNSGIAEPLANDAPKCRGYIIATRLQPSENGADPYLQIEEETAWAPMLRMWKMILDEYLPDAQISYYAVEEGCGIFYTNREDLAGTYEFDPFDLEGYEYMSDLTEEDKNKLENELQEKGIEDYSFHKWEFTSVEELVEVENWCVQYA